MMDSAPKAPVSKKTSAKNSPDRFTKAGATAKSLEREFDEAA
jgi:hypothetical protein